MQLKVVTDQARNLLNFVAAAIANEMGVKRTRIRCCRFIFVRPAFATRVGEQVSLPVLSVKRAGSHRAVDEPLLRGFKLPSSHQSRR